VANEVSLPVHRFRECFVCTIAESLLAVGTEIEVSTVSTLIPLSLNLPRTVPCVSAITVARMAAFCDWLVTWFVFLKFTRAKEELIEVICLRAHLVDVLEMNHSCTSNTF
jgi:hypothetical protein